MHNGRLSQYFIIIVSLWQLFKMSYFSVKLHVLQILTIRDDNPVQSVNSSHSDT